MSNGFRYAVAVELDELGFETIQFREETPWNLPGVALEWPDGRRHALVFGGECPEVIPKLHKSFREWLDANPAT